MQNHSASVAAALAAGFGAEIDVWGVRELRLVLRHDESSPAHELSPQYPEPVFVDGEPSLGQCFPLFLHAKGGNDGFPERFAETIRAWGRPETYVFCSPSDDAMIAIMQTASSEEVQIKTLATVENWHWLNVLLEQSDPLHGADGVWLEQPHEDWVDAGILDVLHEAGKSAWIVSPELHGRPLDMGRLTEWRVADGLVTDYPHLVQRVLDVADPAVHPKEPWWR